MITKHECRNCKCKHFRILVHEAGAIDIECIDCGQRVMIATTVHLSV
jgi:hypothetical protein